MKIYQQIASSFQAYQNCIVFNNVEWQEKHHQQILDLVEQHFPRGSGFDSGTEFDFEQSTNNKLVFHTSFHHMDDNGFYTKWTDHKIIVTPDFMGVNLKVTGKNYNWIKEYIEGVFHYSLNTEI